MKLHHPHLLRLPVSKRHRHIIGFGTGTCIMVGGSIIAHYAPVTGFPIIVDSLAYCIHGIGAIPICRAIDPLWSFILSELYDR